MQSCNEITSLMLTTDLFSKLRVDLQARNCCPSTQHSTHSILHRTPNHPLSIPSPTAILERRSKYRWQVRVAALLAEFDKVLVIMRESRRVKKMDVAYSTLHFTLYLPHLTGTPQ